MPFQAWIRLFGRGYEAHHPRFNGAMPFQAWIRRLPSKLTNTTLSLQWGHALSGMDTHLVDMDVQRLGKALQWGHALSGMDTFKEIPDSFIIAKLQWGHALSGMDTATRKTHATSGTTCFNGAMPFQAWIRDQKIQTSLTSVELQWGHALSGMDTRRRP